MFTFMILALTLLWLLSLFGQTILPGVPHTGAFIYVLSLAIVVLILTRFLSWI